MFKTQKAVILLFPTSKCVLILSIP